MAIKQTMTFHGDIEDAHGMPTPWFHYLAVAGPGHKAGTSIASIISLSEAKATGMAQNPSHTVFAEGTPEAALEKARAVLGFQHPGLTAVFSDPK